MAETRVLQRVTASDLFMLMWEDYGWSAATRVLRAQGFDAVQLANGHR
jgi:hypothetical protein